MNRRQDDRRQARQPAPSKETRWAVLYDRGPFDRVRRKFREVGWLYGLQQLLEYVIPEWLFRINKISIHRSDPGAGPRYGADEPGLRVVSRSDPDTIKDSGAWPWHLRMRIEKGQDATVLERDGEVVAYHAFVTDQYEQSNWMRFKLAPSDVWVSYTWVRPDLRGQRINMLLRGSTATRHASQGYKRYVSSVDVLNRNIARANRRHGGTRGGTIFYVRLFSLTFARVNGTVRLGWWGPGRRLEIDLSEFGETPETN